MSNKVINTSILILFLLIGLSNTAFAQESADSLVTKFLQTKDAYIQIRKSCSSDFCTSATPEDIATYKNYLTLKLDVFIFRLTNVLTDYQNNDGIDTTKKFAVGGMISQLSDSADALKPTIQTSTTHEQLKKIEDQIDSQIVGVNPIIYIFAVESSKLKLESIANRLKLINQNVEAHMALAAKAGNDVNLVYTRYSNASEKIIIASNYLRDLDIDPAQLQNVESSVKYAQRQQSLIVAAVNTLTEAESDIASAIVILERLYEVNPWESI
ncbi:hypothetical protein KC980_02030 [candidate division WWE3 bacterium]|uniref:Uncharacterized protein n=1 Tax=candidate division WWE3 bacterium TaxID=2053526 RepID=A0A955J2D7_UNCKA|nr:hypothetical protein [candidate division WWE3 bacterium]